MPIILQPTGYLHNEIRFDGKKVTINVIVDVWIDRLANRTVRKLKSELQYNRDNNIKMDPRIEFSLEDMIGLEGLIARHIMVYHTYPNRGVCFQTQALACCYEVQHVHDRGTGTLTFYLKQMNP